MWPFGIILRLLVTRRRDSRAAAVATTAGQNVAESVLARWADTDAQTKAMLDLTRKLVALTWAVVALTLIVLASTLYVGLR